jgi:hypothetical protein
MTIYTPTTEECDNMFPGLRDMPETSIPEDVFSCDVGELNPFYGRTHTKETKIQMSETKKGKKRTAESRRKQSEARKGRKHTEEQIRVRSKSYIITDPLGEVFRIVNLSKFCRENGLSQGNMCHVASGKKKSCKGYGITPA